MPTLPFLPIDRLLPSPGSALLVGLGGLAYAAAIGWACGRLKLSAGVRTNYTRKIFHFSIFSAAMLIHLLGGFQAVNAFAAGVVAVVLYGVWRGAGNVVFEGMARERDAPHRAYYVIVPLIATALGWLASNAVAGDFALVGYLATGWGDAAGEPIGVWLGRHEYRVTALRKVPCIRTVEGSAAVFLASALAAALALRLGFEIPLPGAALRGALVGIVTAALEAVSPHGSDNFTTMVGASLTAMAMA
ncbi:MAG: hypothetical protein NTW86_16690 [Candidatus Sumerlaeota bacterium]|nr:hypothetical protein [Candidatus Sumerlaeota bacterium]